MSQFCKSRTRISQKFSKTRERDNKKNIPKYESCIRGKNSENCDDLI